MTETGPKAVEFTTRQLGTDPTRPAKRTAERRQVGAPRRPAAGAAIFAAASVAALNVLPFVAQYVKTPEGARVYDVTRRFALQMGPNNGTSVTAPRWIHLAGLCAAAILLLALLDIKMPSWVWLLLPTGLLVGVVPIAWHALEAVSAKRWTEAVTCGAYALAALAAGSALSQWRGNRAASAPRGGPVFWGMALPTAAVWIAAAATISNGTA
jgi:hypothetical protein